MRKPDKGLIVVGADISQLLPLVDMDQLENKAEIFASWPGPVTWIIPARKGVSKWLTGDSQGLAVRITDHPQLRLLCLNAGILVSTSANPGGYEPARNPNRVRAYFGNKLDYILTGPTGQLSRPTEIRDAVTGRILRSAG